MMARMVAFQISGEIHEKIHSRPVLNTESKLPPRYGLQDSKTEREPAPAWGEVWHGN